MSNKSKALYISKSNITIMDSETKVMGLAGMLSALAIAGALLSGGSQSNQTEYQRISGFEYLHKKPDDTEKVEGPNGFSSFASELENDLNEIDDNISTIVDALADALILPLARKWNSEILKRDFEENVSVSYITTPSDYLSQNSRVFMGQFTNNGFQIPESSYFVLGDILYSLENAGITRDDMLTLKSGGKIELLDVYRLLQPVSKK